MSIICQNNGLTSCNEIRDMSLRAINPKQALKRTQKKYISKQRKYKYFTSQK